MIPNPDDMGRDSVSYAQVQEMDYDKPLYGLLFNDAHAEDVAAASAAYLYNALPAILQLSPPEAFERLTRLFRANIDAYRDCRVGWVPPDPSNN